MTGEEYRRGMEDMARAIQQRGDDESPRDALAYAAHMADALFRERAKTF